MDLGNFRKQYKIQKLLGAGTSSSVYLATYQGTSVAIKIVKPSEFQLWKNERYFFTRVQKCHSERILKLLGILGEKCKHQGFVLELAKKGEIFDYVSHLGPFPEPVARFYFLQLLDTLEVIHGQGMYHGDIKLENILLDSKYNIKLSDFGFSGLQSTNIQTFKGTKGYMAPEILLRKPYSGQDADIFAAVVILFILLAGRPPFTAALPTDPHYRRLWNEDFKGFWRLQRVDFPLHLKFLFEACWNQDPELRPSITALRHHRWMTQDAASEEDLVSYMQTYK